MLPAPIALVLAIVPPLLIGVSRLYLDVHWATDVIGGWVAGVLITVIARLVYNRSPNFDDVACQGEYLAGTILR
jgi:membrane-associated phospholipid phosphatase